MIKNYFKIAFRNLWKNKGYSAINIFGLAVGLATCLLITLYVTDELSYDRFLKNADRIYRINSDIRFGGGDLHMTQTSDMMGQLLKKDYPQVEEYARIFTNEGEKLIMKGNEFITEIHVANVDSTFFSVFALPAIAGDTRTALNEPNTVVITESTAKKYFPQYAAHDAVNVLGKNIEVKTGQTTTPYKINAVIKDIPHNSHINFDFLFSMKNINYQWGQLTSHNFNTYLLLKPGTDYKAFEKNFTEYTTKYVLPYAQQFIKISSMDELKKSGNKLEYSLIPLTDIHLHSDYSFEITPSGNIQYVYIFSAVALFILIIACINFMNLSTARSAKRAKEVGIRKVLGTERKTLVTQFLVESTITATISLIIAIAIAYFVLPMFNDVAAKSLSVKDLLGIHILPFLMGLLAGSYPALFLSGFKPIVVLKGNMSTGFKKSNLRNVLVIFQFATSIMLIIGTIIVYSQLNYIQTKKLGFNKDQVLVIDGAYALNNNVLAFKNEVLAMQGVSSGTISSYLPVTNSSRSDNTYSKEAVMDTKNGIDMQTWAVDYDYIKTMGMEIVKGRNFSKDYGSDSNAILITETTARLLGYDDPVGKMIYAPSNTQADNSLLPVPIIGVVKDFHFESLRKKLGPLCMRLYNSTGLASFKVSAASTKNLIPQIEKKWKALAPGMPFSYRFMSDSFNEMYRSEQRAGTIAIVFAILAILIACLGLFGLVTYMAEQRTKEVGIRKVLGASVSNVVTMLSKDFLFLVLIAAVLAFPLAWWAMNRWLQDFEYRIGISVWVFVIAGMAALLIALITVSFQAIKAAIANPVKSLRTE
jgi:putative ABC transport system permease protein